MPIKVNEDYYEEYMGMRERGKEKFEKAQPTIRKKVEEFLKRNKSCKAIRYGINKDDELYIECLDNDDYEVLYDAGEFTEIRYLCEEKNVFGERSGYICWSDYIDALTDVLHDSKGRDVLEDHNYEENDEATEDFCSSGYCWVYTIKGKPYDFTEYMVL